MQIKVFFTMLETLQTAVVSMCALACFGRCPLLHSVQPCRLHVSPMPIGFFSKECESCGRAGRDLPIYISAPRRRCICSGRPSSDSSQLFRCVFNLKSNINRHLSTSQNVIIMFSQFLIKLQSPQSPLYLFIEYPFPSRSLHLLLYLVSDFCISTYNWLLLTSFVSSFKLSSSERSLLITVSTITLLFSITCQHFIALRLNQAHLLLL